ncbi:MAG TPA: PAS domain S-box protein [Steroidobacteraceae bacterium]|jgi:two-component system sensor kinase FixL|nr:PAS domain S-box protein [Steroidobacteraceae bacterium]
MLPDGGRLDFRALLDAVADPVMIHDRDTKDILWANRAASEVYGCSPEELVKLTYEAFAPADPSYSLEAVRAHMERSLFRDHHTFEWRIRNRAGDEFPIEAAATYVTWDGVCVIMMQFRNITDRKAKELKLRGAELRFHELMQDLAEGVCIVSATGRIEFLTPSASRLLGYEHGALVGSCIHDLLDARTRRQILMRFSHPTSEAGSIRYRIRHATGSWRWHDATYRYVEIENDVSGFLFHFRDITERIAAEKAAREKERMLEYLARYNAMGEMATAIAHELSQPLAAAQNYIEGGARRLARDIGERDEVLRGLRHACVQVDRATQIVRSIRDYVVKLELTRDTVDLNDILNEVRYFVELRARQASVRVNWYLTELPLAISCERVLIGQVILNLAFNAIDEMAELRAVRRLLRIATTLDERHAIVRVEDRGRGLPAGRESKMFDGFFSSKKTGHGIGLALCQNIVSKHGGTIWAEPAKQMGAVFAVKLPLATGAPVTEPLPAPTALAHSRPRARQAATPARKRSPQ